MDVEMIDAISFIKSSEYRQKIIKALQDNILIPSEISQKTNLRLSHISAYLKDLKEHHIVECLNEKNKKGRLYQLTELGKNAFKEI